MISSIKKISSKLKWHLSTSWITSLLLAAVPTMLIVLFFPVSPEKYIANKVLINKSRHCWYYDLESDGEKEMISLDHNPDSTSFIRIRNESDELLGQFNLKNSRAFSHNLHRPTAIDINTDGVKELLLFTQKKDSLFLNTFDYTIPGIRGEKRFITTIGGLNDKHDYRVNNLASYDATGDGIEEYFFSVSGGFALYPRRIFRYDFEKDSLVCSINTGSSYLEGEALVSEGDFTLFVSSAATGNFPADHKIPYPDSSSRIFFFDEDLEMIREPIAFGSYPSGVPRFKIYMETVFVPWGEEEKEFWVSKFSLKGDLIESVPMGNSISNGMVTFFDYKGDTLVYVENRGKESKYILQPESYREKGDNFLSFLNGGRPRFQEDLDGDGLLSSFLAYDMRGEGLFVINEDYRHLVSIKLNSILAMVDASFIQPSGKYRLLLNSREGCEIVEAYRNPDYALRFLYWLIIYILSLAFVAVLFYLQRRRTHKQASLEKQVADLQLQNLRNQLDPHFTFNALNSVGTAIYKQNRDDAYDLFQRFTRMIRSSLVTSNEVFQSLESEIQFTRDYLEFQKTRFRDRFDYSFEIDPELDLSAIEIPKMLIQGFAENAVKHAFYGIGYKGRILITVKGHQKRTLIIIKDNGIGLHRSKELGETTGTQKGLKNILNQIGQINKLYGRRIELQILDQRKEGISEEGTVVKLFL